MMFVSTSIPNSIGDKVENLMTTISRKGKVGGVVIIISVIFSNFVSDSLMK